MLAALHKFFNKWFVRGADLSLDYNRIHGKWCVIYSDGFCSQRMCHDTALVYKNIFGGEIKHINELD